MEWLLDSDRLNRWLTFGANLAVLAGIGLLVYELQQNRVMMRAQTRNEISSRLIDMQMTVAENSEFADIEMRARAGEELAPNERWRFFNRNLAMYKYWENVHYQYRLGLYDEEEFTMQRQAWANYVNSAKSVADVWCVIRDTSSPQFVAEVNALLEDFSCD